MEIKWWGIDCGSGDHPMNTTIRFMRRDLADSFEKQVGMSVEEFFPHYEYKHKLSGRKVTNNIFPFHNYAFQEGLHPRRERRRRHRQGAQHALHHRRLPVEVRGPGILSLPHRRVLRLRRGGMSRARRPGIRSAPVIDRSCNCQGKRCPA